MSRDFRGDVSFSFLPVLRCFSTRGSRENVNIRLFIFQEVEPRRYFVSLPKISLMENSEKSKPEFRVIIAGTRDYSDYQLLRDRCDAILSAKRQDSNIIMVSGTARGADQMGERYGQGTRL